MISSCCKNILDTFLLVAGSVSPRTAQTNGQSYEVTLFHMQKFLCRLNPGADLPKPCVPD